MSFSALEETAFTKAINIIDKAVLCMENWYHRRYRPLFMEMIVLIVMSSVKRAKRWF